MRISKQDVPAKIDAPGALARQVGSFGSAEGYGEMAGEYFTLAAGVDIAPLLEGLPTDSCDAPHWGYVLKGRVTVSYTDTTSESVAEGDLFYWPPGHSVRVEDDAELILFSPQESHGAVMDHINGKLAST
jgi:hypothetical protein